MIRTNLVIVLTKRVVEKIKEKGLTQDDIKCGLDNLDSVRLFHYQYRDGKDIIALPYDEDVLFLARDDGEDYFVATDIWFDHQTNTKVSNCSELSEDTECQILSNSRSVRYYLDDAIDCEELWREICELKVWDPYRSANIEEQKWRKYFELYKRIIANQKVQFTITDITIEGKILRAKIQGDEGAIAKIEDARGESVNLLKGEGNKNKIRLGKLKAINDSRIDIEFDKGFNSGELNLPKEDQYIYYHGEEIQLKSLGDYKGDLQTFSFTFNDLQFSAQGLIEPEELQQADASQGELQQGSASPPANVAKIDLESITLQSLRLSIDFFSEEYQVNTMKRCFDKVKLLPIWEVLSGERPSMLPQDDLDLIFDNTKLNEDQKKAIRGAVGATELFLIWGPPGTGKTEVIKEIAKQEVLMGRKVLITSQTNTAVDNALARLFDDANSYPFRIAKENYELDGEDAEKVPFRDSSPRFYLDFLQRNIESATDGGEHQSIRRRFLEAIDRAKKAISKDRKSEAEFREFKQLADLYKKKINVVGSTLMEAGKSSPQNKDMNKLLETTGLDEFNTVIIDEVSKATPPELFIPIPLGKKLILVGDHKQLPPMFKMLSGDDNTLEDWADAVGIDASELDPDDTIFERLWNRHDGDSSKCRAMLTQQYRMHSKIEGLIQQFYTDGDAKLFSDPPNEEVMDMTIDHPLFRDRPFLWVGTSSNGKEQRDGTSYYNHEEIEKVGKILGKLAEVKDNTLSIGVITFYGAQLRRLKQNYDHFYSKKFGKGKLIFGTVDRFQGRECDVIICSLVRNNVNRSIGFASKTNRINVALSRARKYLIILGSSEQFAYETKTKNEKGEPAVKIYKNIYDQKCPFKPKELG